MKSKILLLIFMLVLASAMVFGTALTYNLLSPADSYTSTSRQVNHSVNFTMSDCGSDVSLNATLWLNGSAISTEYNLSNYTQYDVLYNSTNGDYSWYFNFTNATDDAYITKSATRTYTVAETVPSLSVTLLSPAKYYTSSSTTVTFTWNVTASGGFIGDEPIQCGLWNETGTHQRNYSLTNYTNTTNGTAISFSMTKTAGRHWWYVNCSTTYHPTVTSQRSDIRIFDIDTDYYTLSLGADDVINFSMDTGNIVTAGSITPYGNLSMYAPNGSNYNCGVEDDGTFSCG